MVFFLYNFQKTLEALADFFSFFSTEKTSFHVRCYLIRRVVNSEPCERVHLSKATLEN